MSLNELLNEEWVQEIVNEKLGEGEKFELISLCTDEKMSFEELKLKLS